MKGWLLTLMFLLPAFPTLAADVGAPAKAETPTSEDVVEEIIAKVNGAIITEADLKQVRAELQAELEYRKVPEADQAKILEEKDKNLLRDKIDTLLLVQRGDQLDVKVDTEVTKYMADLMLRFKVADQDKFSQLVREQTGKRYEDFRDEVKNSMLTQRVLGQEVFSRIIIPQTEVQKYYDEHKSDFQREERIFLREILISSKEIGDEAAKKKVDAIVERARRGERFEDLAKENSDATTKDDGGALPVFKKGELRADMEAMVWDKEKNYVADPIKMEAGYLILKVITHQEAGLAPVEEVESNIMDRLREPQLESKIREYLTGLRRQAYLEIKDGWVDSAAAPGNDTSWSDPAQLTPAETTKEEVLAKAGHKRLLWLIPIPGAERNPTSSSR